ncbi:hypothetical protein CLV82_1217 [Zeaxanthinibacter enoshimensis]|uniref:Uncharacterized protein n=1 Tax=Zeaxanthinibacter enoshimensis TaxID=392009 RepID=A0A4R6TWP2_9FLAO|nr:hypothetical protein CLV82_1217 [Zeaxanthinibacter enoshimensis]
MANLQTHQNPVKFNVALTNTYRKTYRNCTKSEQKDIDKAIDEWLANPATKGSSLTIIGDVETNQTFNNN